MPREEIQSALDELREDALLPHSVRLRDMILQSKLGPELAVEVNREFQEYLAQFGNGQKTAANLLERIAPSERKI
ncbi:MAG: hypothetical protein ACRD5W_00130 [Candidatus Acidiferrales bacterium]